MLGPQGWGEYSPFPGFSDGNRRSCMDAALAAARDPWPPAVRSSVAVHVTIPAVSPEAAHRMVVESGCSAAKVKVAEGDDEARVEAVRDALGPGGRLVIDANGAWDVAQAVLAIRAMAAYGLDLVEQPVAGLEDMARLRRLVDVPVAADELVTSLESARRVAEQDAADVLVIKVQSIGGIAQGLKAAEAAGLPVIVSSLLETSIGVSAGLALAAALPELPYPCGLGTAALLEGDVVVAPLVPVGGRLPVRRPEVNLEALKQFEVSRRPVWSP